MQKTAKHSFLCKCKTVLLKIMSDRRVQYLLVRLVIKIAQHLSRDE